MGKNSISRKRLPSNIRPISKAWVELDPVEAGNFCYLALLPWFNMKAKRRRKK